MLAPSSHHEQAPEKLDLGPAFIRFAKALSKFWILVVALSIGLSGFTYLREKQSFRPRYRCSTIISAGSDTADNEDIFSGTAHYDAAAANLVASTFPYLNTTDFMQDLISSQLENGVTNGTITAEAIENTNMVEISVTGSNPQATYDVLLAVLNAYPRAAVYMVDNPVLYVREAPVIPTEPINSFSPSNAVAKGAVQGAAIGLLITALYALLTLSVSNADELRKLVNIPILASFPLVRTKKRTSKKNPFITAADSPVLSEALRGLRTKVRKQLEQRNGKVVLLTSTIPGEGKTTVAANLALSLVEAGHRVVLLDADLRNQTVARIFHNTKSNYGLMELLQNPNQNLDKFLHTAPNSSLRYISGSSTQKRHYALDGKQLNLVLNRLCEGFDYVVVDTPPTTVVSDTTLLCRYADAVLYVVKMNYANRFQIFDSITMLHQKEVPLIGCIINGASASAHRYGYGYGYGSKYGYGKNK